MHTACVVGFWYRSSLPVFFWVTPLVLNNRSNTTDDIATKYNAQRKRAYILWDIFNANFTGLLQDTHNRGLRMRRECRERFSRHWLERKPLVSDPGMHHGTCVSHVPWCMSGPLNCGGRENVPGIPGACTNHNFTYLSRGPCLTVP